MSALPKRLRVALSCGFASGATRTRRLEVVVVDRSNELLRCGLQLLHVGVVADEKVVKFLEGERKFLGTD